jgi:hypothetical protein
LKTLAAALAALMTSAALGACSPSGSDSAGGGEQGKFAGIDQQIQQWRKDIMASDALCHSQAEGEKCAGFEVACKAEREVTPADQAAGVTAHVVAAMTWNGFDDKFKHAQSGMRAVEFTKGKTGWTRADHKPVNPSTCADL